MSNKICLEFEKTKKAIEKLKEILRIPFDAENPQIDGTAHRFELAFDLFLKLLKLILESEGTMAKSPKAVLQAAYAMDLIDNEAIWIKMLDDRKETVHTYQEQFALEIYQHIKNIYYPKLQKSFDSLEATYDKK